MLLTTFILIWLLNARRQVVSTFGPNHGTTYTSAAAIIVESAAPYAIFGFLWVITYGLHNRAAPAFLPILIQFEVRSRMYLDNDDFLNTLRFLGDLSGAHRPANCSRKGMDVQDGREPN
jgi:hypothetical protein